MCLKYDKYSIMNPIMYIIYSVIFNKCGSKNFLPGGVRGSEGLLLFGGGRYIFGKFFFIKSIKFINLNLAITVYNVIAQFKLINFKHIM